MSVAEWVVPAHEVVEAFRALVGGRWVEVALPFRIERGRFHTPDRNIYEIRFSRPFSTTPEVFVCATVRRGKLDLKAFEPLVVRLKEVVAKYVRLPSRRSISLGDLPRVRVPRIPLVSRPDFRTKVADKAKSWVEGKVKDWLGDWGAFNWMRDKIAYVAGQLAYWVGYAAGWGLNLLWDEGVGPQVGQIRSKVNEGLETLETWADRLRAFRDSAERAINEGLRELRDDVNEAIKAQVGEINEALRAIVGSAQKAFDKTVGYTREALSTAVANIYKMLGVPEGVLVSPANVAEVTREYFRVQGVPGATWFWLAIGA